MKGHKVGLSLRYKLLLAISALPIICLSLYLLMATDLFKKDKVAYVFDSSSMVSRSIANQSRIEVEALFESVRPIAESIDFPKRQFNGVALALLKKMPRLHALAVVRTKGPLDSQLLASWAAEAKYE